MCQITNKYTCNGRLTLVVEDRMYLGMLYLHNKSHLMPPNKKSNLLVFKLFLTIRYCEVKFVGEHLWSPEQRLGISGNRVVP